jgi:hypothetical protein
MEIYNCPKTTKYSKIQFDTLKKLESYNIKVCQFIRDAVKEKIQRDYNDLLPKPKKVECPF